MIAYIRRLVVPEEVRKSKEWEIVVSSLEASEASEYHNGKEELFNMFLHIS